MSKKSFIAVISTCLVFLSMSAVIAKENYDVAKYFPLQAGNKWVYDATMSFGESQTETKMAISVFGKETFDNKEVFLYGVEEANAQIYHYYYAKEGIYLTRISQNGYITVLHKPLLFIPNNLQIGQEKSGFISADVRDKDNTVLDEVVVDYKFKLLGVEDVTVKAGEFKQCLKAQTRFSYNSKTTIINTESTNWYALDIGKVKEETKGSVKKGNITAKTEMNLGLKYAKVQDKEIGTLEDEAEGETEENTEEKTEEKIEE